MFTPCRNLHKTQWVQSSSPITQSNSIKSPTKFGVPRHLHGLTTNHKIKIQTKVQQVKSKVQLQSQSLNPKARTMMAKQLHGKKQMSCFQHHFTPHAGIDSYWQVQLIRRSEATTSQVDLPTPLCLPPLGPAMPREVSPHCHWPDEAVPLLLPTVSGWSSEPLSAPTSLPSLYQPDAHPNIPSALSEIPGLSSSSCPTTTGSGSPHIFKMLLCALIQSSWSWLFLIIWATFWGTHYNILLKLLFLFVCNFTLGEMVHHRATVGWQMS